MAIAGREVVVEEKKSTSFRGKLDFKLMFLIGHICLPDKGSEEEWERGLGVSVEGSVDLKMLFFTFAVF